MSDETLLKEEVKDEATLEEQVAEEEKTVEEQDKLDENQETEEVENSQEEETASQEEESLEEVQQEETPKEEEAPQEEVAEKAPVDDAPQEELKQEEAPQEDIPQEESKQEEVSQEESSSETLEADAKEEPVEETKAEKPKKEKPEKVKKEKAPKVKKEEPAKEENPEQKEKNSKSKMSNKARGRRFLIFIVTLYLDLLLAWLFFLKGFFAEFVRGILNGYYLALQDHYQFCVAIAIIVVFILINLLALGLAKDARKLKGDQNSSLLNILSETDDVDGRNIVEEEFSVGGDGKAVRRTSRLVESVDMNRVYNDFIKFALSEGIVVDKITAREIFASLASCRLIFVKNEDKELEKEFFKVLAKFLGVEYYGSKITEATTSLDKLIWTTNGSVSHPSEFAKGLQASRQLPEKINLAFLEDVNPQTMSKYFKELFEYCKNPDVPCMVRIGSKSVDDGMRELAKNLWFILMLEGDEMLPSEVAKYSISLDINIKKAEEKGEAIKFKELSYPQLVDAVNEAYEEHFIAEDMWKKLDEFENYLAKRGEYFIDNRIVRELERFAAIYLVCEGEQTDLIDTLLSKKLLLIALPNTYTYLENDEETIMGMAEKILGADYISNSQAILKQIKTN